MKNQLRIYDILHEIMKLWEKNPELRLMQLLTYVAGDDAFFVEDNVLFELLKAAKGSDIDIEQMASPSSYSSPSIKL